MDKPHKKLDAWKVAMELVTEVYRVTPPVNVFFVESN
jgi:hypothetical protein